MERRTYHHGNLRDALLDAAEAVLAEGREPSLRELALAVGVTPNAPYRHFPDKASLLTAISDRGFQRLGDALEGRGLEEAFARYLVFAETSPTTFRLMFRGASAETPVENAAARRTFDALTNAVAHELPGGSPFVVAVRGASVAWAVVHGWATLTLSGVPGPGESKAGASDLAAIVRAGLRTARTNGVPTR